MTTGTDPAESRRSVVGSPVVEGRPVAGVDAQGGDGELCPGQTFTGLRRAGGPVGADAYVVAPVAGG